MGGDGWQNLTRYRQDGDGRKQNERVGREVETGAKRPPKPLLGRPILLKAFYVVEHKILKMEHCFFALRVAKPQIGDNVQTDSFLGHFRLENRNPCYYTGLPKGTHEARRSHLKNRTLIFEAPGTRKHSVARPFDSSAAGGGLFHVRCACLILVTMICTPSCESWWRNPRDPCDEL